MTSSTQDTLRNLLEDRILLLDGAMGSLIMGQGPTEADYRGELFRNHAVDLKNANDVLCLTQPQIIEKIHRQYLEAGSDIIETDTFNANVVSMEEFQLAEHTYAINKAAAEIAKRATEAFSTPDKPRFVAGSIGPTKVQLSLNPDEPGVRPTNFDDMVASYTEQVRGLIDGGVDLLLPETSFDTLNMKACLFAIATYFERHNVEVPVMVSGNHLRRRAFADRSKYRSVLHVAVALSDAQHWPELCAGASSDETVRRKPVTTRRLPHQLLPERRDAGRNGRVRFLACGSCCQHSRLCRAGLGEHRRWLLRDNARVHS